MHITLPPIPTTLPTWVVVLCWLLGLLILWYWLRQELTPKRVISLFESENSLSIRLVLATVVVVYALVMQQNQTVNVLLVEANYAFAAVLLGLGAAKIVGKAFAERAPDTTVNTKSTKIEAEKVNVATTEDPSARPEYNMNQP